MDKFRKSVGVGVAFMVATVAMIPATAQAPSRILRPTEVFVAVQGPCCGHGTVIVVSPPDWKVATTISVGGTPTGVAVTPDASTALVSNTFGYVSVIDTASSAQRTQIPVCNFAYGIAITPDGNTALVTCANDSTIEPIDLQTGRVGPPIVVGQSSSYPIAIAITPDGRTAYAVNYNSSDPANVPNPAVVPISLPSGVALRPIQLTGIEATAAAVTPDGRRLLVSYGGTTTSGSGIDVIDTSTNTIIAVLPVPAYPTSIAVSADGRTAFVACNVANTIFPISLDGTSRTPRKGIGTRGLALTPDTKILFSTGFQDIDVLDAASLNFIGFALTDYFPVAVAVTPDEAPEASLQVSRQHGRKVVLDASSSFAPTTPIATYAWDFGDSITAVTGTATIAHKYKHRGTYTVRVTLTDAAGTSLERVFTGQTVSRNGGSTASASSVIDLTQGPDDQGGPTGDGSQ